LSATAAVIVPYAIAVYTLSPLPQILLSLLLFSTVVIFIYRHLPSSTTTAPVIIIIFVVRYHRKAAVTAVVVIHSMVPIKSCITACRHLRG
jgi:hypothetical protein